MKHLFIVNPAAGKCDRTVQLKSLVESVLGSRGLEYEIHVSKGPGDCEALARQAAETGEDLRLYACGGDGTLNEVLNGAADCDNAAVTHYPSGSGNDFVKLFDQPEAFRDLERLLDCQEARFDLIRCQSGDTVRYAGNVCSMGLDARIGTQIVRFRRLPLVTGKGAYILSTANNLLQGIHRPYQVELNGQRLQGDQTLICVCNGRCYGGSFTPCPDAEPDDGLLDVLLVKPVNLLQVAMVIGKYQKGQYAQYPDLIRHFRTDKLKIACARDSVVNLDGEALFSQEIEVSVVPRRFRFFYPAGLHYRSKGRKKEESGVI